MSGPGHGLGPAPSDPTGPRPFSARELDDVSGVLPDELVAETRIARELEVIVDRSATLPSADFVERVMDAVGREPVPAPASAAGRALRRGAFGAFLALLRDAWRVTTRPGFPLAVRAQALALVLVVAGLAAGSGLATAGALGLFSGNDATPSPHPSIETRTTSPEPSVVPPEPTDSATPPTTTEPSDSAEPSDSPDSESGEPAGSDDHEDQHASTPAPLANPAPRPTRPPTGATPTPDPTHTEDPEDGDHHDGSATPPPGTTPEPTSSADD